MLGGSSTSRVCWRHTGEKGGGGTGGGAFGKNRNDILFNFFNYFFFNFFLFIIFQVNGEDRGFTTQWW